jgi:uncharacterized repeat protein (TIGR01451 family)
MPKSAIRPIPRWAWVLPAALLRSRGARLSALLILLASGLAGPAARAAPAAILPLPAAIQPPELKWQHGGCHASWCETGWYSSPAVADLDGDGTVEVIASAYSIAVLDGETGQLEWRMASGHDRGEPEADSVGRTWPGIVVADLDGDGDLEIATAHSGGTVSVYDAQGYFEPGWPQVPTDNELRGLSVYDLDGDGSLEVVVTGAVYGPVNTWVYEHDGTLRPGWPQLSDDSGYAYGIFNDNAAVGDLDGDGMGEIVVPSDVHYICAYERDGAQIAAHPMYGDKGWGRVGVWESLATELRGWGYCDGVREESYRTNFAHGPATLADVNGDGVVEVVATGNVYDCSVGHPPGVYNGVYLFNADRSRFNADGYDWQTPPVDTGAPLSENWGVIENCQPNPAVADLDGDGEEEILYASYDGRVHAFWLDKTEHGNWPYAVYTGGAYRFASEPAVADLDADGHAEVIFASWVQKGSYQTGQLHILDYLGNPLHEVDLPPAYGSPDWNGALAAPTLANLDADADLELVLNTAHSGFVAYDLPGTEQARILWGTGRGNSQRTGSRLYGTLEGSSKSAWPAQLEPGDVLTYTLRLENPGPTLSGVLVTDTLPAGVGSRGNLWASSGSYGEAGGTITWTGQVLGGVPVTITFGVTISEGIPTPQALANLALIDDGLGNVWQRQAVSVVGGYSIYLPLVVKP